MKCAVVTGAGTGIGKAAATALLKNGYHVAFAERIRREAEIPTMAVGLITVAVLGLLGARRPGYPLPRATAAGLSLAFVKQRHS